MMATVITQHITICFQTRMVWIKTELASHLQLQADKIKESLFKICIRFKIITLQNWILELVLVERIGIFSLNPSYKVIITPNLRYKAGSNRKQNYDVTHFNDEWWLDCSLLIEYPSAEFLHEKAELLF